MTAHRGQNWVVMTEGIGGSRRLVLRGGTVVDATGERRVDVAIAGGRVVEVAPDIASPGPQRKAGAGGASGDDATVLDCSGCIVSPGLVDLHTHLREPGDEDAETVASGARAAALGGYTAVVAMPNTNPPLDTAEAVSRVLELGRDAACDVAVAGAITQGRAGERLAPMAEMAALGVRIFTDDGNGVQDAGVMRRALEYARDLGVVVAQHCEEAALARGGHMHEGSWSSRLGIPGVPAEAEELMVARDLALVRLTGARMHFLHLSTAGSVALVRAAREEGLPVTAEATPHHLVLTDARVVSFDPVFKVNPPLRTAADVAAVRRAVADGTIDAIATDHAPHAPQRKDVPFDEAAPGMTGLETALALAWTELVTPETTPEKTREKTQAGRLPAAVPAATILGALSWRPAQIAGLAPEHGGPIAEGAAANLCVFDPTEEWTVDAAVTASRSRNNPYVGMRLRGRVRHTVRRGEPVVIGGELLR